MISKAKIPSEMLNEIITDIPNLALLYITGSRLIGVNHKHSDYDFYAFTTSSKVDFVLKNQDKGKKYQGNNYEIKCFNISHLFNLVKKTNPNVIEMFFDYPVFVDNRFKTLADILYQKREQLAHIDSRHFVKSSLGMIKSNINRIRPDKEYGGSGTFGKELFNLIKSYHYGMAVAKNKPLEQEIKYMKQYVGIKNTVAYNENILTSVRTQEMYQMLDHRLDDMPNLKPNNKLLEQLIISTPLYI